MRHSALEIGFVASLAWLSGCGGQVASSHLTAQISDPTSSQQPRYGLTQSATNPFIGADFFVDSKFKDQIATSKQRSPEKSRELSIIGEQSTAIWLDRLDRLGSLETKLEAARAQQQASGRPVAISFVVYNLPERDCSANASNGELNSGNGGVGRYKAQYIDAIAAAFYRYSDLRIIAIIEPDSLPNMATNMQVTRCQIASEMYREGVSYAIRTLAMPHVSLYLDVAHGGWLGWDDNRGKIAQIFSEVLNRAGGSQLIRGFVTNVANYSPLRRANPDPLPDSYYQWNPARDELTFVQKLAETFAAYGIQNRNFIIDTSRNGNPASRQTWGSWCNIAQGGIGERPQAAPVPGVDAFLWVKIPGESDGVSEQGAPRFDLSCQSQDSLLGAPQAGEWFHDHLMNLIQNANPAL